MGHSLGTLSCLALALVLQDALDQMMVLIQHLWRDKHVTQLSKGALAASC